jgi:hypothetical protein
MGYNETYIAVLRAEREKLLKDYYNPDTEGTGAFNTAASVLEIRIKELEQENQNA